MTDLPSRLSPPERWFASSILERQSAHRTSAILRLEQNYGRQGIAFLASAILLAAIGGLFGCAGVILLLLSRGQGTLESLGYGALIAAVVIQAPSATRSIQGIRVGRRFRGSRPYSKR